MKQFDPEAPLVIGGVGGSGTRVVAEIAMRLGVYMGSDLNFANDNHWFTLLMKRPSLLQFDGAHETIEAIDLLTKVMTTNSPLTRTEKRTLARAVEDTRKQHARKWLKERAQTLKRRRRIKPSAYIGWGWKEPNSHIFLDRLYKRYPKMKYIHVIRHGLDMAFSGNQNQLHMWHDWFNLTSLKGNDPATALTFWCLANERAIQTARQLKSRFLLLDFDVLCTNPGRLVPSLVQFIAGSADVPLMHDLLGLPKRPETMGRYKERDLTVFRAADLATVKELGFPMARGIRPNIELPTPNIEHRSKGHE